MRMTPLDIENQKFHRRFRGYDTEAVDLFLEKLGEDYASLFHENREHREKMAAMEARLSEYVGMKEAIERSVTLAQKTADDTVRQAETEARLILRDAELKAAKLLADSRASLEALERDLKEMERRKLQFAIELRSLLETHMQLLNNIGGGGEREPPTGLPRTATESIPEHAAREERTGADESRWERKFLQAG